MTIDGIKTITSLPSPALGLLPAVHDASVTSYTTGALPTVAANSVFQNNSGAAVTLPAFASWPAQVVQAGGYAACDGRLWFPAARFSTSHSFYPSAFERVLYSMAFGPESLPLEEVFNLSRKYDFRLLSNNTNAVWNVVWEIGMRADQETPAPIGPNLDGYTWRRPLIDQQVALTDVASSHTFGVKLRRELDGTNEVWSGSIVRYTKVLGAVEDQLPTGNYFVLRLRLACFDVENAVANPRGFAAYFCGAEEG